ncbi:hypothetical protein CSUI_005812 [Cystoisospora suis]|uniref:Uncharacterized protein n=1 Tax=Cystoisospora suis TaxID=483139 RepID=A0A2C6KW79_9APIC|nr:hypothetical protein CSUI_005812 [Cystoisospora suis]
MLRDCSVGGLALDSRRSFQDVFSYVSGYSAD